MVPPPDERKERVIHTRVSESLDDEIRRKAGRLGLSVSNLVRNILEHTVELVEDVVIDGARVARAAARDEDQGGEPEPRRRAQAEGRVLGWQRALLEVNAVCDACNALLPRGSQAGIAVREGSGPARFRCERCLATSTPGHPETSTPAHPETSTPAHPETSTPAHPETSTPAHPETSTP